MKQTDGPLSPGAVNPLVRTQYSYNARGFQTLLSNYTDYSSGGSDLINAASSFSMTYDALGNKRTEAATIPAPGGSPLGNASHGLTYSYDDANALASANRSVMVSETSVVIGAGTGGYNTLYNHSGASGYAYDAAYNPVTYGFWNGSADAAASYPVNSDNQVAITGINFDGNGNPTTYKAATFSFDPEDRLTAISSPAFSAAYDGDGLRAKKTATGVTTYFVYDGSTPIAEETFNGTSATFTALNAVTADGWRARKQGGIVYQFVYDPQGSVQQRHTDGSYTGGYAAYDRSTFEGYGALRQANKGSTGAIVGQHDPAGFGGQFGYYTDTETGLLCLTHRYYDPGTGKFINRDPIGYDGGMNLYGFCEGNPVNDCDPSGLLSKKRIRREIDPNAYEPLINALSDAGLTNENVTKILDRSHGGNSASTHNPVAISNHQKYGASVDIDIFNWSSPRGIKKVIDVLAEYGFASWYRNPGVGGAPKKWHRHIHAVYAGSNLDLSTGGLQVHRQVQDYFHEPFARNGLKHHPAYSFYNFSEYDKEVVRNAYSQHNRMH